MFLNQDKEIYYAKHKNILPSKRLILFVLLIHNHKKDNFPLIYPQVLFYGKKEFLDKELAELEKRKIYLESLKNAKD